MSMTMLKMMNPMSSMPSVPKIGGDDDGDSREKKLEQEKLRQEEIKNAEKERKARYLKEREVRDAERDKMRGKYNIKKPVPENDEDENESDGEDDGFGVSKKAEVKPDALSQAKTLAEDKFNMISSKMSSVFKF